MHGGIILKKIVIALSLIINLILVGCTSNTQAKLEGTYQSDIDSNGYIVQIAVQPDDNSFVEYISNREVDRGTYEQKQNNIYKLKSKKQNFEIALNDDNSFEIIIDQLNEKKTIELKNIDKTPMYFSTNFDDVEKYEELLNGQ